MTQPYERLAASAGILMRDALQARLPISEGNLTIRRLTRGDMDTLAQWPSYPWPYDVFRFSFSALGKDEMDAVFQQRASQDDRITLVMDADAHTAVGYVALLKVDWFQQTAGNMGIRIHPAWCNKGIGARMLDSVRDWWFGNGMRKLVLDVAASNQRAVACYTKVGFVQTGEFWRNAPELKDVDLTLPEYAFLDGHVGAVDDVLQLRFYWMEATRDATP